MEKEGSESQYFLNPSPKKCSHAIVCQKKVPYLVGAAVEPDLLPDADVLLLVGLCGFRGLHLRMINPERYKF